MNWKLEDDAIKLILVLLKKILTSWFDNFLICWKWVNTDNFTFFPAHNVVSEPAITWTYVNTVIIIRKILEDNLKKFIFSIVIEYKSSKMIVTFCILSGHGLNIAYFIVLMELMLIFCLLTHVKRIKKDRMRWNKIVLKWHIFKEIF